MVIISQHLKRNHKTTDENYMAKDKRNPCKCKNSLQAQEFLCNGKINLTNFKITYF